jgi:hypothetical protein
VSLPKLSKGDWNPVNLQPERKLDSYRVAGADSSAAKPARSHTRNILEHEQARFVRGLPLALGLSVFLWAALAAVGYGAYLLVISV